MNYVVGIDLGTTNCAVAYVAKSELKKRAPRIDILEIPQLTRPGAVEERPLLPSFVYQPAAQELPAGSTLLPWDKQNKLIVGELARSLGAKVPARLVASAKSWLCSTSVDRTAKILPWGAIEDVARMSPVEASAAYLRHIREAWDATLGKKKENQLAAQDVILTVPASFDEAARELSVEAARQAGLPHITLLEEPQGAFYAWIAENSGALDKKLKGVRRVLVCDVGGGTTDFSLIDVRYQDDTLKLTRTAVGDHLMLGGDNMDLALARFLEKKFPGHIDAHQFRVLTAVAREAKEKLFATRLEAPRRKKSGAGDEALKTVPVTLIGRGSAVIGGTLRTELTRQEAEQVLLSGFFPLSKYSDEPATSGRSGIREWGLPYVHDPAVTRHLAQFLRYHLKPGSAAGQLPPDAVLFNGGSMKPQEFRDHILDALEQWFNLPHRPVELDNPSPDLSVAVGAAYYGCVRRGAGMRIGGGMGRAYYIGIETDLARGKGTTKAAMCLVPHGTEEGTELELPQVFMLPLGSPIVFPLFSSTVRTEDTLGELIDERSMELAALPPLETALSSKSPTHKDVPVRLRARLTEVGTLALSLKAVANPQSWEVHLNIRAKEPTKK